MAAHSDDEILEAIGDALLERPLLHGVIARAADDLQIAQSTITRRFGGSEGVRRAFINWVLRPDSNAGADWAEQLAEHTIKAMEEQADVVDGLTAATALNWDLVTTDQRMRLLMLIWSRAEDDPTITAQLRSYYEHYDRIHRSLWQDILEHVRSETNTPALQRPGLSEHHFLVALDCLVEGFVLRSAVDPTLPIAEIYAAIVHALMAGTIDFEPDLESVADHLRTRIAQAPAGTAAT